MGELQQQGTNDEVRTPCLRAKCRRGFPTVAGMSHRTIRYALLLALEPIGTVRRVSELVAAVRPLAELGPRPSKLVSDLLRVELMRGRVTRPSWGRYQLQSLPRTTRGRAVAAVSAAGRRPGMTVDNTSSTLNLGSAVLELGPSKSRNDTGSETTKPANPHLTTSVA